ncbi:MAG: hypothetical protein DMD81_04735 [Candidatus Rokuibacteriota bacterium]|nr:MAG: hypothetical protein DMD81_04735 [Candidatus Rokubacteria bacterium]
MLYLVMKAGGAPAILVLVGAMAAAAACALVLAAREERTGPAAAGLAVGGGLFLLHFRLFPRAEIFSFFLLSILVLLLASWRRGRQRALFAIPPLFLLWGNLHPGVLAGGLVLSCHVVGEGVAAFVPAVRNGPPSGPYDARRFVRLLVISAIAALALLANPYGFGVLSEAVRLSRGTVNQYIAEWVPPTHAFVTNRPSVQAYRVWTGLLVLSLPFFWWRRCLGGVLAAAALLTMAMRSVRFIAVYGVVTAPLMAVALEEWLGLALRRRARELRTVTGLVVASLLVLGVVPVINGSFYRWEGEERRFGFGVVERDYPGRAVAFMRATDIRGTVFNEYRWGGWLGWTEGMQVFQDGRTIDESLFYESTTILNASPGFEAILDRYGIDVLLLRYPKESFSNHAIFRWLATAPGWALVFWDDDALVYLKRVPRFEPVIERFAYRRLSPFAIATSKALLLPDWARLETEIRQVKEWSPRSGVVRQIAGQLYDIAGMQDRAKAEFLEGYRLEPGNGVWESLLRSVGGWPPG